VPRDLETVVLRCLEAEPERRYTSAADLADDLHRWLHGEPILSRRPRRRGLRRWPWLAAALVAVGLAAPLALSPGRPAPEDPLKTYQRRLAAGQPVTLIGDKGPPVWSRWVIDGGGVMASPEHDGTFTVSVMGRACLLLLPGSPRGYRLSAEIRHNWHNSTHGEVGLAFGHSRHVVAEGPNQCFATLTFNDLEARFPYPLGAALPLLPEGGPSSPEHAGWLVGPAAGGALPPLGVLAREENFSRATFSLRRLREPAQDFVHAMSGRPFYPAGGVAGAGRPWRRLAVDVTPAHLEIFWDGRSQGRISRPDAVGRFRCLRLNRFGQDECPELQPSFSPEDGLGLFLVHAEASFRRVVVRPLR
jgi:hypothetical protein